MFNYNPPLIRVRCETACLLMLVPPLLGSLVGYGASKGDVDYAMVGILAGLFVTVCGLWACEIRQEVIAARTPLEPYEGSEAEGEPRAFTL